MHKEWYTVSEETAEKINKAKEEGRRIIAVGTTSVRTLESAGQSGKLKSGELDAALYLSGIPVENGRCHRHQLPSP